jgi:NTP pyrophosphatase (non-canonical NTP hydrolase)
MSNLNINDLVRDIHQNAKEHGWWEEERTFGDIISLCHCELSEAIEEFRDGRKPNEIYYSISDKSITHGDFKSDLKPEGIPIELADVIIRIFDYCGHVGIDINAAILEKIEFNKSRPYKHGGKVI